jgi:hypothetical protein
VKPVSGLSAEGQQRFIEEMFLLPGLHRGINIIGASGGAEFALESALWNNGVFTATIIEALRDKKADLNGDTRISVGELRDYLGQRVSELTKGAQKPSVVASERDQDFDLIRVATTGRKTPSITEEESQLPPETDQAAQSTEAIIRDYYRAVVSRDEVAVQSFFAETVNYLSYGNQSKAKVLADHRGDWKRYSGSQFEVSNFVSTGPSSCQFILDYSLMQGERPRRGKLQMTATFTDSVPQKITSLQARVISAKLPLHQQQTIPQCPPCEPRSRLRPIQKITHHDHQTPPSYFILLTSDFSRLFLRLQPAERVAARLPRRCGHCAAPAFERPSKLQFIAPSDKCRVEAKCPN